MKFINKREFGWQSRYYDRRIRDKRELRRIRDYIRDNTVNWENDKYYFTELSVDNL